MKFKIISDSSSNIYSIGDERYTSVPLTIRTSQKEYVDTPDLDIPAMIAEINALGEKTGSSCPNINDYEEAFADADTGIIITISRGLSGSYNAARLAIDEHPEKKITLIDTCGAGADLGLVVTKAAELMDTMEYDELSKAIVEYNSHCHLLFALQDLTNLAINGRVPMIVAKACGVLGIRVVGMTDFEEGKFNLIAKCRGQIKTTKKIVESLIEGGYKGGRVRIDHCNGLEPAEQLKKAILDKFPQADVQIGTTKGLCSFYAQDGGIMIGFEDL